jgi:hypothetical protein
MRLSVGARVILASKVNFSALFNSFLAVVYCRVFFCRLDLSPACGVHAQYQPHLGEKTESGPCASRRLVTGVESRQRGSEKKPGAFSSFVPRTSPVPLQACPVTSSLGSPDDVQRVASALRRYLASALLRRYPYNCISECIFSDPSQVDDADPPKSLRN